MRSNEPDLLGQSVGHIKIVDVLSRGGMGTVYVGEDETLQRKVAVKAIHGEHRMHEQAKARFLREARLAAALNHPSICTIYAVGEVQPGEERSLPSGEELKPGTPSIHLLADETR